MIVEGFHGPGGWATGRRILGLTERAVGMEWDASACATAVAAGHTVIRCDVSQYPTWPFKGRITGKVDSPPCQAWTRTGNGLGLIDQPLVHQAVADLAAGRDTRAELRAACKDERSLLAAEPMRWHHDLRPEWIAMEEVPDVLTLWQQYAQILRGWGYSVWVGVLDAADYGVPQTRRRAILIASRVGDVAPPEPTHARHDRGDDLFGDCRPGWVSTGRALGWTQPRTIISNYGDPTTASGRGERTSADPSWTITSKISRVKIVDPKRGDITRFTMPQASILQSFPADYPWQGTKTKQEEQLGNAVPPLLAAHVLSAATGIPMPATRIEVAA